MDSTSSFESYPSVCIIYGLTFPVEAHEKVNAQMKSSCAQVEQLACRRSYGMWSMAPGQWARSLRKKRKMRLRASAPPHQSPLAKGMAGWGNQGSSWTPPSALMSRTMPAFRLALAPQPGIPHSVSGLQVSRDESLTNRPPCIPTNRRSKLVFVPLKQLSEKCLWVSKECNWNVLVHVYIDSCVVSACGFQGM